MLQKAKDAFRNSLRHESREYETFTIYHKTREYN